MNRILLITLICTVGSLAGYGQGKVLDKFGRAMWNEAPELLEQLCTPHFWNNEHGSTATSFYDKSKKQEFKIERGKAEPAGDRVVFHVDVIKKGKRIDKVYFYMVKKDGNWLVDGIDHDANHIPYFLKGVVDGHFNPNHLEEHQGLHALGDKMIKAAKGEKVDLGFNTTGNLSEYLDLIEKVEDIEVEKARYFAKLDKGVIHYIHMYYEDHEDLSIYFHLVDGKWKPYSYNFHEPKGADFYTD